METRVFAARPVARKLLQMWPLRGFHVGSCDEKAGFLHTLLTLMSSAEFGSWQVLCQTDGCTGLQPTRGVISGDTWEVCFQVTFVMAQVVTHRLRFMTLPWACQETHLVPSLPLDSRLPESAQLGSCLFLSLVADVTMKGTAGMRPWA